VLALACARGIVAIIRIIIHAIVIRSVPGKPIGVVSFPLPQQGVYSENLPNSVFYRELFILVALWILKCANDLAEEHLPCLSLAFGGCFQPEQAILSKRCVNKANAMYSGIQACCSANDDL
jgi:hypothetical protein